MDDPLRVRRLERLSDLPRDRQRFGDGRASFLCQRLALDQFEHDCAQAVSFLEAIDCADVWVIERRQRAGLAFKSGQPLGIADERIRQDLDRHVALQFRVARAVDLAHSAGSDQRLDFVRADARMCAQHDPSLTN